MFSTEGSLFWIIILGVGFLILEVVILRPYRKKSKITPKRLYNITIVVIISIATFFTIASSIGLFLLESRTNTCLADELTKVPINPNEVHKCVTYWDEQKLQLIGLAAFMTIIMLSIQLRELAKTMSD